VKFHADEHCFPCSIEYLMKGGKLEYRRWNEPDEIAGQTTITPALVVFQDSLHMLYAAVPDHEVWVTRSSDGPNWTDLHKPGLQVKTLAVTPFQGQLWMVFSRATDSQVRSFAISHPASIPAA
jgi:hypothetical protein